MISISPEAVAHASTRAAAGTMLNPDSPVRRGPILLAVHGRERSPASIAFARDLSRHLGLGLEVVSVVEPTSMFSLATDVGVVTIPQMCQDITPMQEDLVQRTLHDTCQDVAWHLTIAYGSPAQEIARRADDVNATMIVVGAAPHRVIRHEVSGVRAIQVLRRASCPVVSVAPHAVGLPLTVVAAIDFSPASIRAAEAALLTLGSGGTLILAYVPLPESLPHPVTDYTGAVYGVDIGDAFERLRAELRPLMPRNATLETRQLEGTVATALLDLATAVSADLITAGRHSRNVIERLFVGSIATTVMHGATCSVLESPDPSAAETFRLRLRVSDSASTHRPEEWAEVLAAASARNAERAVTLEEDDPAIGAQVQATGFVLRGIDYDERTRRVDIMLGRAQGPDGHLTRTIHGVDAIAIKAGPGGRDQAIEVEHGNARTHIFFDG